MNVCVLGDFSENNLDEGFKNIAYHITKELSDHHKIVKLNIKEIFSTRFWRDVRNFDDPKVIHHLTDPSLQSFIVLKILALYWRDGKTITSALFPNLSSFSKMFVPLFKPDLILTQSNESDRMFRDLGCRTRFLSNGVDIEKFVPVNKIVKEKLREKYELDKEKFIVLHVGHIKEDRNLQIFDKIQREDIQGLIVGSKYIKIDREICQDLENNGCKVYLGYIKRIEEIYALSDCYIFPVKKNHTILTPLSVMEAMSCNLPVITRKFDGLARIFSEGNGLIFAKKEGDFLRAIDRVKKGMDVKTREKVLPYSWKNIAIKLDKIYNEII